MRLSSAICLLLMFWALLALNARAATLVSNVAELKTAVSTANAGGESTILLADGTYHLDTPTLHIMVDDVTVRGASGNRDAVILQGQRGMSDGSDEFIFLVDGADATIADLTMEDVGNHAVMVSGQNGANNFTVSNCVFRDTFEQMLKATPSNSNPETWHSENGVVEDCLFEYTAGVGPQWYVGGVDVHSGKDWTVRGCTFKNIRSPERGEGARLAEHAIHFWSFSRGTLVENNTIINCDRGVGFGLGGSGHIGGVIRNNAIYHADLGDYLTEDMGDVGIIVENSPGTQIYNNTVYFEHFYQNAIEWRFSQTTGVYVANNLCNRAVTPRDSATGSATNNETSAQASWFESIDPGGSLRRFLRLVRGSPAVDQGTASGLPAGLADIDGQPRPFGAAVDQGADEWRPASSPAMRQLLLDDVSN